MQFDSILPRGQLCTLVERRLVQFASHCQSTDRPLPSRSGFGVVAFCWHQQSMIEKIPHHEEPANVTNVLWLVDQ